MLFSLLISIMANIVYDLLRKVYDLIRKWLSRKLDNN